MPQIEVPTHLATNTFGGSMEDAQRSWSSLQPAHVNAGPQRRHSTVETHLTLRVQSAHSGVQQDGQGKLQSGPGHSARGEGWGEEGEWRGGETCPR